MRWKALGGALNAAMLIDGLRRLLKGTGRATWLIPDNLPALHSKPLKAFWAAHRHEIEVFYLPCQRLECNSAPQGLWLSACSAIAGPACTAPAAFT